MGYTWEKHFSSQSLMRGKVYYDTGRVKDIEVLADGNIFKATVMGTEAYRVVVQISNNRIRALHCTCPFARDGHNCKHEAALLYAIEAEKKQVSPATEVKLFADARRKGQEQEDYRYYQLEQVAERFRFQHSTVEAAKKLIANGNVTIGAVKEYYRDSYPEGEVKVCQVWAQVISRHGVVENVRMSFTRDRLMTAECRVSGCYLSIDDSYHYSYYGNRQVRACEHVAAVLLLAEEYIRKHHLGDTTDYAAQRMIQQYRDIRKRDKADEMQQNEEAKTIHLEPRVTVTGEGEMELSFKVGMDKLYVVKNLKELVSCVEMSKEWKLGQKQTISFLTHSFREEDEKYFRYIEHEVKDEELRNQKLQYANAYAYRYTPMSEEVRSSIPLYGRRLDAFYEMCQDEKIPLVRKDRVSKKDDVLTLQQAMPELELEIVQDTDEQGEFQGICIRGERPELLWGEQYQYFLKGNTLNRADAEALRPINALPTTEDGQVEMTVGRRYLTEFYRKVLPILKEFAEVREPDRAKIEPYVYPEAEYVFLIDAPEQNVVCDVKVRYGEAECKLAELAPNRDGHEAFRDLYGETEMAELMRTYFPYVDREHQEYHCQSEDDLIYRLISEGVPALLEVGEVRATERFKRLNIRRKPQVSVGVRIDSDLLNLSVTSSEYTEAELLDLIDSYRKKKKYHRLKNGDFVSVENETVEELAMMMDTLKIAPKEFAKGDMKLPIYRALYLDKMLEKNDTLYAKRDKHFKEMIKSFKTVDDSEYEMPESMAGVARNYQNYGYKWLRTIAGYQFGGILADDMGLGKTMQMIAVLLAAKEEGRLGTALIVTPASLVFNWREEFEKFAPGLDVELITGTKAEREQKIACYQEHDVLVTSYDLLKRDIEVYEGKTFAYQVIDEAQFIKTHTTAVSKAVKVIDSRIRFALTGTPIENRLSELWSIFDFLMPGFLYSYEKFRKEMETPIAKNQDEAVMAQLKRMVEPFILRRLKGDVLKDLPEKLEEVQYVAFEEKQQALYDGQVVRMRKILASQSDDEFRTNKMQILAEITRLRQICCDPSLYLENYQAESAKRQACMELIQSAIEGEHKMLVFSQFTSMLELLELDLKVEGIEYYKITGATPKEERVELVRRFNQGTVSVFLISLKAGGTGLNLTGADIVIHYDPWWNIAAQNQATDRAHRIGQEKQVTVFKLIVKNTIEEKILKLQESKRQLAEEILEGPSGGIMSMSKDELYGLLLN